MKEPVKPDVHGVSRREAESGVYLGLWEYCPDGYVWRSDVRLAAEKTAGGPWLVAASERSNAYPILRRGNVLSEFLSLSRGATRATISSFAARYGHLEALEPVVAPDDRLLFAEPLGGWLRGLDEVRHLSETLYAIDVLTDDQHFGQGAVNGARRLLRERLGMTKDNAVIYHVALSRSQAHRERFGQSPGPCTLCGEPQDDKSHTWRRLSFAETPDDRRSRDWSQTTLITVAGSVLAYLISEHLRGHVDLQLLGSPPEVSVRHAPDSLLAAIFLQLAFKAAGRGPRESECDYCHSPFFPGRRDQRFCGTRCRDNAGYHRRRSTSR